MTPPAATAPTSASLSLRILSALCLAPVVTGLLIWGGIPLMIFLALAFAVSVREWNRMARQAPSPLSTMTGGTLYLCLCFAAFIWLRLGYSDGAFLTLTLMVSVWGSDSVAFLFGKTIGGPKLAPKISPKKTWAGLIGAMTGSSLVLLAAKCLSDPVRGMLVMADGVSMTSAPEWEISWIALLLVGALLGVVGQAGDLLVSVFKRKVGLKDTGDLIPGHGGLLDRIDALLLVTPIFLLWVVLTRI